MANRYSESKDCFRIVIVRYRSLTVVDAPSLHTMDADRLKQGRVGDAVYGGGMTNDE